MAIESTTEHKDKNEQENENASSDISKKEYLNAKSKLKANEIRKNSKSIKGLVVFAGALIGLLLFIFTQNLWTKSFSLFISIFVSLLIIIFLYSYFTYLIELISNKWQRIILEYETSHLQEEMKEDIFQNSIEMSYRYLDQYYLQIREHAQKGFFVTIFVSIVGAILVAIGIILMFLDKTNPSYVTAAAGVITEFISAVFFYLYNKTITSMSNYHNKLILSQNISIALKITDSLPKNEQINVKKEIIKELLNDINGYLIVKEKNKE